ncbi:MAG: DnaD domain protein [Bacilli bacterium]|nr:DnaD domain protein [Bacilli bacterium]
MKNDVLTEVVKINNDLIIPGEIVKYYDKLNLDGLSFILLIYLINQKDTIPFDPLKISKDLNIESSKVLELINELNEKNYIYIDMKKNNGVIEEFISTDLFYNKLISLVLENEKQEHSTDIYSTFEKELGRTLSPTEINTINNWLENDISEELILEALKESVLSGVFNLRYIDSILFTWVKKGYKNVTDVKKKQEKKTSNIDEVYDFDWLNE